jgi:hypothetical protein
MRALKAIREVVDPPELWLTPMPVLGFAVVGQARLERFDLLPHRGQILILKGARVYAPGSWLSSATWRRVGYDMKYTGHGRPMNQEA